MSFVFTAEAQNKVMGENKANSKTQKATAKKSKKAEKKSLGAKKKSKSDSKKKAASKGKAKKMFAVFDTNHGSFKVLLYRSLVPETVANFVGLATGKKPYKHHKTKKQITGKYYDDTVFHRVIDGFMIQGGDPTGTGRGSPGYTFTDEFHPLLRHDKEGIVSMANSGPNTNGSQFFITVGPTPHLDRKHSIFGKVAEGYDVVKAISKVPTTPDDKPLKPVKLNSVTIVEE